MGVICLPSNSEGYVAPAASMQVAVMSVMYIALWSMPLCLMPSGQWMMKGVDMPPSCIQLLNRRKGALLTFAQGRS